MAQRTITRFIGIFDTSYDPNYGLDLVAQAESLTLRDEVARLNAESQSAPAKEDE